MLALILYYIGIITVFVTHIYMLIKPEDMKTDEMIKGHAIINLVAAILIAIWFVNSQKK